MKHFITRTLSIMTSDTPRIIRILLPDDYEGSSKSYPVLYMHDGQNLFEDQLSFNGHSWRVYETLIETQLSDVIIVGIDNSDLRLFEYSPWKSSDLVKEMFGIELGGFGDIYADFVVHHVKPMIDRDYRTLTDEKNTWIAGSSMGAYISVYIALKYAHTFGSVGVFSLASWFNEPDFLDFISRTEVSRDQRYFISIGDNESSNPNQEDFNLKYLQNSRNLKALLVEKGLRDIYYIETHDIHHELAWRQVFKKFILWVFHKA